MQTSLVEINELGPTIQQGVIQRFVRGTQPDKETRFETQIRTVPQNRRDDNSNLTSGPEENGGDRLPSHNGKSFPEGYQHSLNDVARPVFVNHYYAGEPLVPVMNKRYIRLDECDVSLESAVGILQMQGLNHEFAEHSRESLAVQCPTTNVTNAGALVSEHLQERNSRFYSEFPEQLQNSLKDPVQERSDHPQCNGVHGKFREASRHSLGTLNVSRSRVQAASCVDPQVPSTGYEQYPQEIRTYPVAREPVNVQPMTTNNNSALLDLPNMQTDLPKPLMPQQVNQPMTEDRDGKAENTQQSRPSADMVTSNQILESIQNITRVMQQQLVFNGKTTEAGILQTASLFQEMIKAQEKRDLDPALMAIPTFLGQAADRPQCLDWVSRVKNVCDQSGRSFCQELINKSGILVQNFIRSLVEQIMNKELAEKILQFFSAVPMTSHALNKL